MMDCKFINIPVDSEVFIPTETWCEHCSTVIIHPDITKGIYKGHFKNEI